MPWSGGSFTRTNGVNTGATLWAQDRDDGTKILATRHDTNDQDMADGINSTLEKSGSNAATGNLDIGSNRITLVADGTAKTDVATVNQIQSNGPAFQATDTGTANAYVIALTPAITAYAAGQEITFKAGAASTTASTLNVNTLGAKALKKLHDQDIASGDIESGSIVTAVYDGTNFQVTSQLATEGGTPGGSDTQVQYNSSGSFAGDADLTFDGTELTAAGVNLAAFSGVLEANANFVDQVIFGPSVDGMAWSGLWSKASVFSSLMLATVEDAGADSQINIWDLTTKANTTPLGTVTLSGDATPTSIAAAMGYIIVGSEDGISIIDPHSGAWAERTSGWPRTLSSSTVPALTNNDVQDVDAGLSDQPPFDPRTGGPLPDFACAYGTGADYFSLIKHDGNVWDKAGTVSSDPLCIITSDGMVGGTKSGDIPEIATSSISGITADDFRTWGNYTGAFLPESAWDEYGGLLAGGSSTLFTQMLLRSKAGTDISSQAEEVVYCHTNRTYTTGYMSGDIRGAWLANSKTADRSVKGNTLTENGTVTEGAVESGAELNGYSGWSGSNYCNKVNDADIEMGTAAFSYSFWYKSGAVSGTDYALSYRNASSGATPQWGTYFSSSAIAAGVNDGSNSAAVTWSDTSTFDSKWHKHDVTWSGATGILNSYIDGVLVGTATNASVGSLSGGSAFGIALGASAEGGSPFGGSLSLARLSATAPTATQIRQMYDAEKGMFVASAECLLQSGSTDAVLDVNVDPLTNKVLVTQTDAITVFDGLVVDSKPTVNSGTSEKGKLWGDLRAEQNSANAYVTAPATDQRQVNEMVRGLANDMPGGVDLSKAKAWIKFEGASGKAIFSSFNIKKIVVNGTGDFQIHFGVPFKSNEYVSTICHETYVGTARTLNASSKFARALTYDTSNSLADCDDIQMLFFGELENE